MLLAVQVKQLLIGCDNLTHKNIYLNTCSYQVWHQWASSPMSYAFFFAEECFQHLHGDTNASCDSSGMMKLWDIWKSVPILSIDAGPHPANQVTFDHSGRILNNFFYLRCGLFLNPSNLSQVLKPDSMCEIAEMCLF